MQDLSFFNWMISSGIKPNAENSLLGLNYYLCSNSKEINDAYLSFEDTQLEKIAEAGISSFHDTNLIKRTLHKFKSY